jgi:hypothetical protein
MRLRSGLATLAATLAVSGMVGVSGAAAGEVNVIPVDPYALFFYSDSLPPIYSPIAPYGELVPAGERNDVEVKAVGGTPGKPTTIVVRDRAAVIDPESAISSGCTVLSLHKVTCTTTQDHFGYGNVYAWGKDDRITLAEDSQPIYGGRGPWPGSGWSFACGDGEDHLLADPAQYTDVEDCETVEGY